MTQTIDPVVEPRGLPAVAARRARRRRSGGRPGRDAGRRSGRSSPRPAIALRVRPEPGEWSVLECVGHIVDSELIVAARASAGSCAEDEPDIVGYDQALWVDRLGHNDDDPGCSWRRSKRSATRTSTSGRADPVADRERIGRHRERGAGELRDDLPPRCRARPDPPGAGAPGVGGVGRRLTVGRRPRRRHNPVDGTPRRSASILHCSTRNTTPLPETPCPGSPRATSIGGSLSSSARSSPTVLAGCSAGTPSAAAGHPSAPGQPDAARSWRPSSRPSQALDAAHPEWVIALENVPQASESEKVTSELAAGDMPDVLRLQGSNVQQWIRRDAFLDLDPDDRGRDARPRRLLRRPARPVPLEGRSVGPARHRLARDRLLRSRRLRRRRSRAADRHLDLRRHAHGGARADRRQRAGATRATPASTRRRSPAGAGTAASPTTGRTR